MLTLWQAYLVGFVAAEVAKLQVQNAIVEKDDEYISTVVSVKDILGADDKPIYIRKITALNNGRAHHIIVDKCRQSQPNPVTVPTYQANCQDKSIIFAWALNAEGVVFPEGSGIRIGGHGGFQE